MGDAAGLVNPFTGEGLSYALVSGTLAAAAVLAHRDDPAAAQSVYVRKVDFLYAGNVEASRRAVRRDHLSWRFLSDAAESDHPFVAKGRRAILLPEGLRGITDTLIAPLDPQLQHQAAQRLKHRPKVRHGTVVADLEGRVRELHERRRHVPVRAAQPLAVVGEQLVQQPARPRVVAEDRGPRAARRARCRSSPSHRLPAA